MLDIPTSRTGRSVAGGINFLFNLIFSPYSFMVSYPSKAGLVDSDRLRDLFTPQQIDWLVHLAYFALQQEAFQFAPEQFRITDEELLEFYYRVGSALGMEPECLSACAPPTSGRS